MNPILKTLTLKLLESKKETIKGYINNIDGSIIIKITKESICIYKQTERGNLSTAKEIKTNNLDEALKELIKWA